MLIFKDYTSAILVSQPNPPASLDNPTVSHHRPLFSTAIIVSILYPLSAIHLTRAVVSPGCEWYADVTLAAILHGEQIGIPGNSHELFILPPVAAGLDDRKSLQMSWPQGGSAETSLSATSLAIFRPCLFWASIEIIVPIAVHYKSALLLIHAQPIHLLLNLPINGFSSTVDITYLQTHLRLLSHRPRYAEKRGFQALE